MNKCVFGYLAILTCVTVSLTANDAVAYRNGAIIAQAPAPAPTSEAWKQYAPNVEGLGLSNKQQTAVLKTYIEAYNKAINSPGGNETTALTAGHKAVAGYYTNMANKPTTNLQHRAVLSSAAAGENEIVRGFSGFSSTTIGKSGRVTPIEGTKIMKTGAMVERQTLETTGQKGGLITKRTQTLMKIESGAHYTPSKMPKMPKAAAK